MNYKNIIICEFSLKRNDFWIKEKKLDIIMFEPFYRELWFEFRTNIFKNTLYQSIQHQTKNPDKVYLLFDIKDDILYKKYFSDFKFIEPIFSKNLFTDWERKLKLQLIKNKLTEKIVVSKIDSDDIISKNYLENLNNQLTFFPTKYTYATKGYISNLYKIQSVFYNESPFCNIYQEKISSFNEFYKNIIFNIWPKNENYTEIHNAEFFQLIHGSNLCNNFYKELKHTESDKNYHANATPITNIDKNWFKNWAGFDLPEINLNLKFA